MTLADLGWNESLDLVFAPHAAAGLEPARVVCELRRNFYGVHTAAGEVLGECGGGFFHVARTPDQFPAVGDWVALRRRDGGPRADIHAVLPRRTKFSRRAAGSAEIEQIVAANIDTVFLVSGLDRNFNPKRIQRFLVAAHESGATPVVILNKSDLCRETDNVKRDVEALAPGVPVLVTSTATRKGLKALTHRFARPGRTLAFIGSSGVGKSSLINALVRDPEALPTGEVREKDSKGRHTTTRRELVRTPSGAFVIDTPGMRELRLWDVDDGVEQAFADIGALARRCRFTDCGHQSEPGCAVLAALAAGELPPARLEAYRKLKAEQAARAPRERKPGALASKPGWRKKLEGQAPFRHRQQPDE
ncbi:MAG: ribosome small subunit-dependent GTPase A [Verrucomicrobia bacterium]|nr:ribosome small subunit-dependent GTPase A [Verrucomicrobiota bacterium]